jgi:two-component system response regulator HydG
MEEPVASALDGQTVLVVDDEEQIRESVRRVLQTAGYAVDVSPDGRSALSALRRRPPSLLLTDLRMPDMDGMDLLRAAKAVSPETQVIVMTAFGTVESAVHAMKEGADDFLEKPVPRAVLLPVVERALERYVLLTENRLLREELERTRGIQNVIGQSNAMHRILSMVYQVAPTSATILIQGETGTGKEVIARAIHQLSPRRGKPFVSVNCAALPETLIESELFGYDKGAFTGATGRKIGRFQQADGGTLFLDEIAEMQTHIQVKLLRAIEEGAVQPLGSTRPLAVDVRFVAATNRNLEERVRAGTFREELYYRLNVVSIELPPLRDRREDIPLLVHHFIRRFAERDRRPIRGIESGAMRALQNYSWQGNVRQLENVVERAVILAAGDVIALGDLPPYIVSNAAAAEDVLRVPAGMSLADVQSLVIHEALRRAEGNKEVAAKALDISSRTIYRWLRREESNILRSNDRAGGEGATS